MAGVQGMCHRSHQTPACYQTNATLQVPVRLQVADWLKLCAGMSYSNDLYGPEGEEHEDFYHEDDAGMSGQTLISWLIV